MSLTVSPTFTITPTFTVSPTVTPTQERAFHQQEELEKLRGLYPVPFDERLTVYFTLRVNSSVRFKA